MEKKGYRENLELINEKFQEIKALTINQVTEIFPISESTIRRAIKQKAIPFFKIGGTYLITKSNLARYMCG